MGKEFIAVEYLECPFCHMIFDPKGIKKRFDDVGDEVLTCRYCEKEARYNRGIRKLRV